MDEVVMHSLADGLQQVGEFYPYLFPPPGLSRISILPRELQERVIQWSRLSSPMKLGLQYVAAPSVPTVPRLELISTYPVLDNVFKELGDVLRRCSDEDFDNDQVSAVARGKFLDRGWALDILRRHSYTKEQVFEVTFSVVLHRRFPFLQLLSSRRSISTFLFCATHTVD